MSKFSPPYKVVIVDDDDDLGEMMIDYISDFDFAEFECKLFQTADSALEYLSNEETHLTFVDINLPGGDGHSLMKKVSEKQKGIFFVMMTGSPSEDNIVECFNYRDHGYMIKPFEFDYLESIVRSFVSNMQTWQYTMKKLTSY